MLTIGSLSMAGTLKEANWGVAMVVEEQVRCEYIVIND